MDTFISSPVVGVAVVGIDDDIGVVGLMVP